MNVTSMVQDDRLDARCAIDFGEDRFPLREFVIRHRRSGLHGKDVEVANLRRHFVADYRSKVSPHAQVVGKPRSGTQQLECPVAEILV